MEKNDQLKCYKNVFTDAIKQCSAFNLIHRTSEASDGTAEMKGVDSEGDAEAAFGVGGLAKDFCGVL